MPKPIPKRKRASRPLIASKIRETTPREVTVDDVIKDLLDLFSHLGLDAGRLASRVVDLDPTTIPSHSLYPHASAIGELLTAWHQDTKYLDELGSPVPLKMHASGRSFRRLAEKTVPKMHPKKLLTELQTMGAVTIDDSGHICVQLRSLPVYEDKRLAIQHTLASLDSFVKTLRHNLNSTVSNSDQLFHRVAWNGDFDAREIPTLKINVKRHGQSFLESCDNWMMRRTKSSAYKLKTKGKPVQVSIGVYLAVDDV
jgi:Family of unknown function (DUF6502)